MHYVAVFESVTSSYIGHTHLEKLVLLFLLNNDNGNDNGNTIT